ncbi:ATP-dependent nuclease [Corallococcus exiguus]|uniref:ATP-dependent nuclease n=1 Tax=Corallococcus exiguus TaxID=83462 RepID=UPI003DA5CD97
MLKYIRLNFGPSPHAPPLQLTPGPITLFIGPNNSGKSLLLKEVAKFFDNPKEIRGTQKIVADLDLARPAKGIPLRSVLDQLGAQEVDKKVRVPMSSLKGIPRSFIRQARTDDDEGLGYLGEAATLNLDGRTRLSLVEKKLAGDLLAPPEDALNILLQDETLRQRLRKATYDTLGLHAVIDPTGMQSLRLRMSARAPEDSHEELGFSERVRSFHRNATDIMEMSDGIKAYTGTLMALLAGKHRIITLDEPEAFLHPALARRLALDVANIAKERGANTLVATHSAEFLMGCIEAGANAQIVRLTYSHGTATARHLPAEELVSMMQNPLLRTTHLLSALFHAGVIVTEAEKDRAFYDEVNHRLMTFDGTGSPGTSFIFAQNKQTTHMLVAPLRRLGIPAATIVDMDFIKDGGRNFTNHLNAARVPEITQHALSETRVRLKAALDKNNPEWKTRGGIKVLGPADAEACRDFIQRLADYGIFIVEGGELESWLPKLGMNHSKHAWLYEVFDKMGSDPSVPGYVSPEAGDVWDFIRKIARWIHNPNRKGMAD